MTKLGHGAFRGNGKILDIAVVGTGIAGMAAAWLLASRHRVTVYESEDRVGGHSNTVELPDGTPVDTGFIVYNEATYPNLTALFRHLDVPTRASDMSFAVSLDDGGLEYGSTGIADLFAQKSNLVRPRFWAMLRDVRRFYREAPLLLGQPDADRLTLGDYLTRHGYSSAFVEDHLLPMAAAIWSASGDAMRDHPASCFIRFCANHGLLTLGGRPQWRTVAGGSREYVRRLTEPYADRIFLARPARSIFRGPDGVLVSDAQNKTERFDQIVIAAHADQALSLLSDPDQDERKLLGAIRYQENQAILHSDPVLMPRRRAVWSSWNYLGRRGDDSCLSVTYWMNRLQGLRDAMPAFVTLNPSRAPRAETVIGQFAYHHPLFDCASLEAQRLLWRLQGRRATWFCGAYFGAGFHEDGLQSGLAVAEQLGGVRRPWNVADESGRIHVLPMLPTEQRDLALA